MLEKTPLNYKIKLKPKGRFRNTNEYTYNRICDIIKKIKFLPFFLVSLLFNIITIKYNIFLKKQISIYKRNCLKHNFTEAITVTGFENNENDETDEKPVLNISKDELLKMCYKSRAHFYEVERKRVTDKYLNKFVHYDQRYRDSETIQNKLNYLIVHESPDYKSKIADKIKVHEYVEKVIGKDICVPILKIYSNADEINFDELPNQFALKCNHGTGMNIIVNDKSSLDINTAKRKLDSWKNTNYGLQEGESQYINIERQIFAEQFLKDDIEDYKIYCFHGEPKFIRVQKHKISGEGKINNYYSLDWKLTDIETGLGGFDRDPNEVFEKPKYLDLMISYAKKLSAEFVFVRVDFYEFNDTVYLGEMTFSPSNSQFALKNIEQSKYLGSFIDLSKIRKYLFN